MKKIVFLVLLLSSAAYGQHPGTVSHVILISIDGFHPDMYLDQSWPAPNLRLLLQRGAYADHMTSVFPAYTYPAHTAMLTGALPARSKILYNQPIGSKGEWNWYASYIKVPTLWQAMHQAGLTTAAVMWPGSVGGPIDYNIPEIWAIDHPDDRISETRKYATPGLVEKIERYATGKLDSTNFNDNYLSLDENAGRMAAYLFKTYKPSFLALHFACVDGMEHQQGRDGDSVRLAVAADDRAIGEVLQAIERSGLKDSTTVLIVGDHGFCTIHTLFRPNMLIGYIPAHFTAAGGSAFLYRNQTTTAADAADIIRSVTAALDSLPRDKRQLFRILDRQELDRLGADSAALLALAAVPGTVFSGSTGAVKTTNMGPGTLVQQSMLQGIFTTVSGGHHGYDPSIPEMYTGFIAEGAGIIPGRHIEHLSVTDIAPLVAELLHVSFNCPDGKLVPGILF